MTDNGPANPSTRYSWVPSSSVLLDPDQSYGSPIYHNMLDEVNRASCDHHNAQSLGNGNKGASLWTYGVCDHESYKATFGRYIGAVIGDDYVFACNPSLAPGDRYYVAPARLVCKAAGLAVRYHDIHPGTLENCKNIFQSQSLPRDVYIDRDPFDTEFSIWYTLVDLLDLLSIFKSIGKSLSRMNSAGALRRGEVRLTARQLADNHLLVQFGFIPTVTDIVETIAKINNWRRDYDKIQATFTQGRFRRFQHPVSLHGIFPGWHETVSFNFPGSSVPVSCKVNSSTVSTWRGLALYGFNAPEFSGFVSRLKQLVDSFGILEPQAVWDLIPFSFVLDWFFTTSSYLHQFKPKLFPASVLIYDYLESIKVSATVSYRLTHYYPSSELAQPVPQQGLLETNALIGTEEYTTYTRHRFKPDIDEKSLKSIRLKTRRRVAVDINRVAIAASLLNQRSLVSLGSRRLRLQLH